MPAGSVSSCYCLFFGWNLRIIMLELRGTFYLEGIGVSLDYEKGTTWLTIAAEQGYAEAQYNIGNCYRTGKGFKKDKAKAREWLEKAANQGHEAAKKDLERL